jgi:hypothetical protein
MHTAIGADLAGVPGSERRRGEARTEREPKQFQGDRIGINGASVHADEDA